MSTESSQVSSNNNLKSKGFSSNSNGSNAISTNADSSEIAVSKQRIISKNEMVAKRNGMLVPFKKERIHNAISSAFKAKNNVAELSPKLLSVVDALAESVEKGLTQHFNSKNSLNVEEIQDAVEMVLMKSGHYDEARLYIRYREEHKVLREGSLHSLRVRRRDGKGVVKFKPIKIATAIELAFRNTLFLQGVTPQNIIEEVNELTKKVVAECVRRSSEVDELDIEWIQDTIERQMMKLGYYDVAKDFIIYRADRAKERESRLEKKQVKAISEVKESQDSEEVLPEAKVEEASKDEPFFVITKSDGTRGELKHSELRKTVENACKGLEGVSPEEVYEESIRNFYEGIRASEIETANIMAARAKVEKEPNYSFVAARFLLDVIYREAANVSIHSNDYVSDHRDYFKNYIKDAIDLELISPELLEFDLDKIASALDLSRDADFTYLGLQTLYDRYFIHSKGRRIETPQAFWMRVAMGLALLEGEQKNEKAIEFYNVLSKFEFISSTPTLFNSGTLHSQMSSCYLSTIMDDLGHIFKCIGDDAQLSKWAGGLGNDWTNIRATGSRIKGTNGKSQGIIPFLKVANDTAVAVNQGGKRKGAMCAYLETWHLDIEDFLELRKNTGDERRRTHDMNTANWIPDLFMKRVVNNEDWTLFSPSDVPDLHDTYGKDFEKKYCEYEEKAKTGEISLFKKIKATDLWKKMLSMLFETGHPWITFKDPSNIRSPQDHAGVVHSSNLCTEILLNTSKDETAVCNLGSINLSKHINAEGLDHKLLRKTIKTAMRMLDNVIDLNFYPIQEASNANLRHRPVGLGIMGFQDALYGLKISYASEAAVQFADESMEAIAFYSLLASADLASERGAYESFKGSKWDRGLLPIDTLALVENERGSEYFEVDRSSKLDWSEVREAIEKNGLRNSNTLAIAPTATISNIAGVTQSIEPSYKHLFTKSNLSGEFMVHNTFLVDELKERGLWNSETIDDLKYFDGSILEIESIPEDLKRRFLTAFEVEPEWLVECAARRQKWIDMGQSLNLYMAVPSGKKLHEMYMLAWKRGLKTTYYLRALGATQIEKSTTDINKRGLQPRWMKSKSASSKVVVSRESAPVPKATCNIDGDCESCQ